MLITLLIILLIFSLIGGRWGYARFGAAGFSPVGLILVIALILVLTGHLRI